MNWQVASVCKLFRHTCAGCASSVGRGHTMCLQLVSALETHDKGSRFEHCQNNRGMCMAYNFHSCHQGHSDLHKRHSHNLDLV